ncbi:hypothetical protein GQ85_36940, partial [Rhodococcus rhodochrous]
PLVIGPHGGKLDGGRKEVPISRTFATARSVEYDALLLASAPADPRVRVLVDETFRHCKAIGTWGAGTEALEHAAVHPEAPGVVTADDPEAVVTGIIDLLGAHRVWERAQA